MKALIIAAATLVASATLGSIPASAKSGCQNKQSVAVGNDKNIIDIARLECITTLKRKAATNYGFDYGLKDGHFACTELGYNKNTDPNSSYE